MKNVKRKIAVYLDVAPIENENEQTSWKFLPANAASPNPIEGWTRRLVEIETEVPVKYESVPAKSIKVSNA